MKEFYAVHILRYKGNSMKQYRKFMIDTNREKMQIGKRELIYTCSTHTCTYCITITASQNVKFLFIFFSENMVFLKRNIKL